MSILLLFIFCGCRHLKGVVEFKADTKSQKHLSRARKCMTELEKVVARDTLLPADVQHIWQLSVADADSVFQRAFDKIFLAVYPDGHPRKAELCYGTFANLLNASEELTKSGKPKVPRKKHTV